MTNNTDSQTHPVMVRPTKGLHRKLVAIAEAEHRDAGPQALKFIEESIDRYISENPQIADQLQAQA